MKTVLLDQDGVLTDFEEGFLHLWRQRHDGLHKGVAFNERRNFHLIDDYPSTCHTAIREMQREAGFFRSLPPIPGAIDAANELIRMGVEVRICTSPLTGNRFCPSEKYEWVEEHMGDDWVRRTIITKDKTFVNGTVLVDDKPLVIGNAIPRWHHVLYDAPYNQHVTNRLRFTWETWKTVLPPLLNLLES